MNKHVRTVAENLKAALITKTGRTVTEIANQLEMSRPAFSNVLNGNASLSIELALKLETTFGLNARQLLIAQLDKQIAEVRNSK